jgi:hypothetical protein
MTGMALCGDRTSSRLLRPPEELPGSRHRPLPAVESSHDDEDASQRLRRTPHFALQDGSATDEFGSMRASVSRQVSVNQQTRFHSPPIPGSSHQSGAGPGPAVLAGKRDLGPAAASNMLAFDLPRSTANNWIRMARERYELPGRTPTTRGE